MEPPSELEIDIESENKDLFLNFTTREKSGDPGEYGKTVLKLIQQNVTCRLWIRMAQDTAKGLSCMDRVMNHVGMPSTASSNANFSLRHLCLRFKL
jgi:hypothetical protein